MAPRPWRRLLPLVLLAPLALAGLARSQPQPAPEQQAQPLLSDADAVAAAVLRANPEIEALSAHVQAMEQGVPQAGVWADPMVGVEYSNMPLTAPYPGAHPMAGVQLRVSQALPAPGKIGARQALARQRVTADRSAIPVRQNELVAMVRTLYHELALHRQLAEVTRQHIALVEQLSDVVQIAYEVGRAAQHELMQLQVLADRLRDDLEDLGQRERSSLARLNAALHRNEGGPIETPAQTALPELAPSLDAWVRRVQADQPELARFVEAAKVEGVAADRADAERHPDVTLTLGYRVRRATEMGDAGEDFVTLGAQMPLPWLWNDERWGARPPSTAPPVGRSRRAATRWPTRSGAGSTPRSNASAGRATRPSVTRRP